MLLPSVRLISLTQPVGVEGMETAEQLIAWCARVSNPSNQNNHETAPRLLRYLARHGHWSPFEMVSMGVEIVTTRDISRQILRHRSFSFQEFSQRYATSTAAEPRPARAQDPVSRQSSHPVTDPELQDWWEQTQREIRSLAFHRYAEALERGVAREVARTLLPEGLTISVLYMHGSIRSWIHYCQLRCRQETQLEHRQVALACRDLLLEQFPSLAEFFKEPSEGEREHTPHKESMTALGTGK